MFATDSFINAEVSYREREAPQGLGDVGAVPAGRRHHADRAKTPGSGSAHHGVGGARHNGRRAHSPQRRSRRTRCRAGGPGLPARHSRVRGRRTPYAVLLAGDAGVGKTRLLTELRDVALGEGWLVLAGHCLDLADGSLPYLPFSEILGRVLTERPEVAASVTERHPTLARLQPGRRLRATDDRDEDQSLDRGNIFAAVHDLLETLAAGRARCSSSWRTPTGPTSRPATCSASSSPGRSRTGRPRRVLPRRRPPPSPPAPPPGRRVGRLREVERVQVEPLSAADIRVWSSPCARDSTMAEASSPRSSTGPRATPFRRGARGRDQGNRRQLPAELADVLSSGSTGSTTARRWSGSRAGRRPRVPRAPGRGLHPRRESTLERGVRGPRSSPTSSQWPSASRPTGSATPCSARRSTMTCCPASAALLAAFSRCAAVPASLSAPPPSSRSTPAGPATAGPRVRRIEAGNQAIRSGGPTRPPPTSWEALDNPPQGPAQAPTTSTCPPSSPPRRGLRRLRSRLQGGQVSSAATSTALPGRRVRRGARPAAHRPSRPPCCSSTPPSHPRRFADEAVALLADGPPQLLARALGNHACPGGLGRGGTPGEARDVAMEALALAERHGLNGKTSSTSPPRSPAWGRPTRTTRSRRPNSLTTRGGRRWGRRPCAEGLVEAELRGALLPRAASTRTAATTTQPLRDLRRGGRAAPRRAASGGPPTPPRLARSGPSYSSSRGRLRGGQPPPRRQGPRPAAGLRVALLRPPDPRSACSGQGAGTDTFHMLRAYWSRDGLIAHRGTCRAARAEQDGDPTRAVEVYDHVVETIRPCGTSGSRRGCGSRPSSSGSTHGAAQQSAAEREAARRVQRLLADGDHVLDFYAQYERAVGPEYHAGSRAAPPSTCGGGG